MRARLESRFQVLLLSYANSRHEDCQRRIFSIQIESLIFPISLEKYTFYVLCKVSILRPFMSCFSDELLHSGFYRICYRLKICSELTKQKSCGNGMIMQITISKLWRFVWFVNHHYSCELLQICWYSRWNTLVSKLN